MVSIDVTSNIKGLQRELSDIEKRQIPFATSKAINTTAIGVKKAEQAKLDRYFELRTKWLTKFGAMPIQFSSKRQAPNIYATLGVVDEVAALSATGGTRFARTSTEMAVPMSDTGGGVSTREILNPARRTLPRSKWPGNITGKGTGKRSRGKSRKKPRPFFTKLRNGERVVAQRRGNDRLPLRVLYKFEDKVKISKTWPLIENTEAHLDTFFAKRFYVELNKALATAR